LERKKQYLQSRLQVAPVGLASRWKALAPFREAIVPKPLIGVPLCPDVAQQNDCRAKLDAGSNEMIAQSLECSSNAVPPERRSLFQPNVSQLFQMSFKTPENCPSLSTS
jgi:hypothetical protein